VFFDATAEYHRSDESSDSLAFPIRSGALRGAEHRCERERLRIRWGDTCRCVPSRGGRASSLPEGVPDHSTRFTRAIGSVRGSCRCLPTRGWGTVERAVSNCASCAGRGQSGRRVLRILSAVGRGARYRSPSRSLQSLSTCPSTEAGGHGRQGPRGNPKAASRCATHRGGAPGARHAAGTRRHLPWGSFPFGEESQGDRCASVCLSDAFRPQGFSPSRRFDPTRAVWLFFTPLPPIGLPVFRAFPTQPAAAPLDARCSLAVGSARADWVSPFDRCPRLGLLSPIRSRSRRTSPSEHPSDIRTWRRHQSRALPW
jgi:hypothetical protein